LLPTKVTLVEPVPVVTTDVLFAPLFLISALTVIFAFAAARTNSLAEEEEEIPNWLADAPITKVPVPTFMMPFALSSNPVLFPPWVRPDPLYKSVFTFRPRPVAPGVPAMVI